ncbi:cytochrome c oxidase assembly protein [Shouchella patagoniensis]|uniref:cytochrome c oxidase assembly protein n=1 Tax=Shouchella patagoniensis TaxID=228576 RepID=UPI0009949380|nr:cytochrome c oxidase assembly protein [Shouchella patagoniensis]
MSHHHGEAHAAHSIDFLAQLLLGLPFVIGIILYVTAVILSKRKGRSWAASRTLLWVVGSFLCIVTVVNPMATAAHERFVVHMFGHLLLGMLGPLLMVLAAPMTLLLRSLRTSQARSVTAVLRSRPIHILSNPVVPALLNIGGLWLLYTTSLFHLMETTMWIHVLVHLHIFLAGYFFAAMLLYIDPIPYRYSYLYRSLVLVFALAGHKILSKYIYAFPPDGVPRVEAEAGGMLMYYGGDAVDLVIIVILCAQWYKSTRPKEAGYPVSG